MVALLGAAVLGGCQRQPEPEPDAAGEANASGEAPPPARVETPPPEPALPRGTEPTANITDILPEDAPVSPDEQMQEDADATGLTARTAPPDVVSDPPADPVGDLISSNGVGT